MGAYVVHDILTGTGDLLDRIKAAVEANGWTVDGWTTGVSLDVSRTIDGVVYRFSVDRYSSTRLDLNGYTAGSRAGGRATPIYVSWPAGVVAAGFVYVSDREVIFAARDSSSNVRWGAFGKMATIDSALGGAVPGAFVFGHNGSSIGIDVGVTLSSNGMIRRINGSATEWWSDSYTSNMDPSSEHVVEVLDDWPNISGFRPLVLVEYGDSSYYYGWLSDNVRGLPMNDVTSMTEDTVGADTWLRVVYNTTTNAGLALKL